MGAAIDLFHRHRTTPLAVASVAAMLVGTMGVLGWILPARAGTTTAPWDQAQGGPDHTGTVVEGATPPYRIAWHLDETPGGPGAGAGQFGLSAPVLAGDTAVSVGARSVVGVDASSGGISWRVDRAFGPSVTPAVAHVGRKTLILFTEGFGDSPPTVSPSASPSPSPSPSTSPSTSSGAAFDSHLLAIDATTREPAWKSPVQLKEVSRTGVAVEGDAAFVGDNRGNVYAVDAATGSLRWIENVGGFLTTSIAVSRGEVIVLTQGTRTTRPHLVALHESDGSMAWNEEVTGAAILGSSPAVAGNSIFVGFSDQSVRAFDLSTGTQRWSARLNSPLTFAGAPAVSGDAVVVADEFGQIYKLDAATGRRIWDFALNEPVLRAPVVVIGGDVLVATLRGRLAAIALASGRLVWESSKRVDSLLRGLTPAGALVLAVRGGRGAGLDAFEHDPGGHLVSIASPTTLAIGKLLGAFAAAAVPTALVLLLGGRLLLGRLGPAFEQEEGDEASVDADPWDDDGSNEGGHDDGG